MEPSELPAGGGRASWSFTTVAGALVRRGVIYQLQKAALLRGLGFSSVSDGGWFQTEYCITVGGGEEQVRDYQRAVAAWVKKIREDGP